LPRRNEVRARPARGHTAWHAADAPANRSFAAAPGRFPYKAAWRACCNDAVMTTPPAPQNRTRDMSIRPKYITFDCYGTLTRFRMSEMTRDIFAERIPAERMEQFIADFSAYRFDEVLGAWQPYEVVLKNAVRRLCRKWKIQYLDHDAQKYYDAVPTWGPHDDVPAGLSKVAREIPLVILSNASDDQIQKNVAMLGAPFHRVYTAQQAQAYKPRLQAFEYMLDSLGCNPEDVLHVSSSLRYDLMSADDLGIVNKVFVNRGHGPGNPAYRYVEIKDIGGLPGVVGL
jgi:2-haloacid dehalogenase